MLTLLSTVKTRLRLDDSDVRDDDILSNFIDLVSARFENDCNRSFTFGTYSDEFQGDETELRVKAYPINSITSISLKTDEAEGFIVQDSPKYVLRHNFLVSLRSRIGHSTDVLKLIYTG